MASIKASVTVSIGGGSDSATSVSAEVDTRSVDEGGLNASTLGKTSDFTAGDEVTILVWIPEGAIFNPSKYPDECYIRHNWEEVAGATFANTKSKTTWEIQEEITFDGSSRLANLSKMADENSFKVCLWRGFDLEKYYGGKVTLDSTRQAAALPSIPKSWLPKFSGTESTSDRASKMNTYTRKTRAVGIAGVRYKTTAEIFKLIVPSESRLESFGKAPQPFHAVIYCREDKTDTSSC